MDGEGRSDDRSSGAARSRIRWGIVGCGDVTEVKSGPAFARVPDSELVAVMRRDGEAAQDYARRHSVARWTDDADELIHDPEVDAVYVATPPSSHAEYVSRAASAGKPVYVEKPMGMTLLECEGMIRACERAEVPLFVAYYRRLLPRFLKVRELLRDGVIGEPLSVEATLHVPAPADDEAAGWRWRPEVSAGGLFVDVGSHVLDLLDDWFGPVADVSGRAASRLGGPAEDVVAASFVFESGVLGTGTWNFAGIANEDAVRITGRRGRIEVPVFAEGDVTVHDALGRTERHRLHHPAHVQEPLIRSVVDELLGRGACPSTGSSAARTQGVIDAVLADHRAARVRARVGRAGWER